jgi:diadenylate cyclase
MEWVKDTLNNYIPSLEKRELVEILIIAFLVYHIMKWIKASRAWSLVKGFVVIGAFILIAYGFQMHTILWIASNVLTFGVTALIVVLQPELRKALDTLGKKNILLSLLPLESNRREEGLFSDKTVQEVVKAAVEMGKTKTGLLIVIQQKDPLGDYERTGIDVDAIVTSQLLVNIFEHNTPLHDGAVIIRGNRIISATCYLPLSDNMDLGKELGTRHRAGVGISEVTDSLTVIVSEETGKISVAYDGKLERGLNGERLKERLIQIQNKNGKEGKGMIRKRRKKKKA